MMVTDAERLATLETEVKGIKSDIEKMGDDLADVKRELLGRPQWSVVFMLTFLSSLCVGLAVALAAQITG